MSTDHPATVPVYDGSSAGGHLRQWWPMWVGGFLGAPLSQLLLGRVPGPAAAAAAFFTMWIVVGLIFIVRPPNGEWRFGRWIAGGAAGAAVAALLTFVF